MDTHYLYPVGKWIEVTVSYRNGSSKLVFCHPPSLLFFQFQLKNNPLSLHQSDFPLSWKPIPSLRSGEMWVKAFGCLSLIHFRIIVLSIYFLWTAFKEVTLFWFPWRWEKEEFNFYLYQYVPELWFWLGNTLWNHRYRALVWFLGCNLNIVVCFSRSTFCPSPPDSMFQEAVSEQNG